MKIEYIHGSKYGNGATVADEFKRQMATKGVEVEVHHVHDVDPKRLPPADLYLFSSPGRMGKPIGEVRRALEKVGLPAGTRYAILTTEIAPRHLAAQRTGRGRQGAGHGTQRPRSRKAGRRRWRGSSPRSRSRPRSPALHLPGGWPR